VTPLGIDPETFRLAVECLNHYATPGPRENSYKHILSVDSVKIVIGHIYGKANKQAVVVMLQSYIQELHGSSLGCHTTYPDIFHDFPKSLQRNYRIIPQLGHTCCFPNAFHVIIYPVINTTQSTSLTTSQNKMQKVAMKLTELPHSLVLRNLKTGSFLQQKVIHASYPSQLLTIHILMSSSEIRHGLIWAY
jgi:hypothetical protein